MAGTRAVRRSKEKQGVTAVFMQRRIFRALVSVWGCIVALFVAILCLGGAEHFVNIVAGAFWYIVGISLLAAILGLIFGTRGLLVSAVCGVCVGLVGFFAALAFVAQRI